MGTACLCSTWHHVRGLKVWELEPSEGPFAYLVADAGKTQRAGGRNG